MFTQFYYHPNLWKFSPASVPAMLTLSEFAMDWQTNQLRKGYTNILIEKSGKVERTVKYIIKDLKQKGGIITVDGKDFLNKDYISRTGKKKPAQITPPPRTKQTSSSLTEKIAKQNAELKERKPLIDPRDLFLTKKT